MFFRFFTQLRCILPKLKKSVKNIKKSVDILRVSRYN